MEKFCTEEEFLRVVIDADYNMFNEIMSRSFIKGVETAILYTPEAMDKLGKRMAHSTKAFGEFIEKHPDFQTHKEIVLQEIHAAEIHNPLETMERVLEIAAPEIERKIRLSEGVKL